MNPEYTVLLQVCDNTSTLYYKAAVVDRRDKEVIGFVHASENYNEALACARVYFDELAPDAVVASYIEQPGRLVGQGAFYAVGQFAARADDVVTDANFYDQIAQEFIERLIRGRKSHINVIFRRIVEKHKLDLYKEGKLLAYLQARKVVQTEEDDTETWLKKQLKACDESTQTT